MRCAASSLPLFFRYAVMPVARKVWFTEFVAPGDHVRARHFPELFRAPDAGKEHEVPDCVLVGTLGAGIADVLEPFGLGRHIREVLKLGGREQPGCSANSSP